MPYSLMTDYFPTARVEVAFTAKDIKRLRKEHGAKLPDIKAKGAVTHTLLCGEGLLFIVHVKYKQKDDSFYSLLAHEATHMADEYMDWLGEDKPSREFRAYTVQSMMRAILRCIEEKDKESNER